MKRISLILYMVALAMFLKAQETTGGIVFNYSLLERKLEKSNEAIQNEKKASNPKTWLDRGELFMEIYSIYNQYLNKGMNVNIIKTIFKEPKSIKQISPGVEEYVYDRIKMTIKDGELEDWEETDKIYDNPLPPAKEALEKALQLDTDGKLSDKIKEDLIKLKGLFESEAIYTYNKKKYKESFENFDDIIKINELPVMDGIQDTVIYYSAGRAAREAGDNETAIKLFKKAFELNLDDPYLYVFANESYKDVGDTLAGLEVLKKGFLKYPDNQSIQIELINYYLLRGQGEKALEYLQIAKDSDPTNISFLFAEGTIYDKLGKTDEAIKSYKNCLDINQNYYNANYNLSIVYYNMAVKILEDCQAIENVQKYNACQDSARAKILEAIPYMEKAREVGEDMKQVCDALETLKTLYYRTQQEDKRQAILEELTMQGCQQPE